MYSSNFKINKEKKIFKKSNKFFLFSLYFPLYFFYRIKKKCELYMKKMANFVL